ncbi:MAG: gamma-glutamylcyclotransferase [Candidatus Thorarchaeota archaeon]
MSNCDRCDNQSVSLSMSYFNTEMICKTCTAKEENHPQFKEAKDKELEECMKGNFNFEGIGKPVDL